MPIVIDLVIVAIFAIFLFLGFKNGLTKSLIKILSFGIALIVAIVFFKPVSNLVIQNTEIDDNIKKSIVNMISGDIGENGIISENSKLPKAMVDYINNEVGSAVNETKSVVVEKVATTISEITINVGVAIGLFIIVRIALMIISALTDLLTDLPGIKQFDKLGGIIYGALKGILIIYVLLALISLISPAIEQTGIVTEINKSYIGDFLYNHNILLDIIF